MSDDLVGSMIAGRYRVVRLLGEGGMGQVYAAIQDPLGREVALKVIRGELMADTGAVERFRREAATLSQLAHPNIVTIFDFGNADGMFYLAMELLRGHSLRDRLDRVGTLSAEITVSIMHDVCSALAVAHGSGVIHRDLKPDNVMLVDAFGRRETAKILDFGVAKLTAAQPGTALTQAGMLVGTPGYMAPELALRGMTNDPRADLYALGVMWFEMLCGRPPFTSTTPVGLVMQHATAPPPRLRDWVQAEARSALFSEVEGLVMQLLEKDPDARPASAAGIVHRLDAITAGAHARTEASLPLSSIASPQPQSPPVHAATRSESAITVDRLELAPALPPPAAAPAPAPAPAVKRLKRNVLFGSAGAVAGIVVTAIALLALEQATSETLKEKTAVVSAKVDETKPVETKPIEARPIEAKPIQAKPIEAKPIEAKPIEAKPIEAKPIEAKPIENKPVERKPRETKAMETTKGKEKKDQKNPNRGSQAPRVVPELLD